MKMTRFNMGCSQWDMCRVYIIAKPRVLMEIMLDFVGNHQIRNASNKNCSIARLVDLPPNDLIMAKQGEWPTNGIRQGVSYGISMTHHGWYGWVCLKIADLRHRKKGNFSWEYVVLEKKTTVCNGVPNMWKPCILIYDIPTMGNV
jgi:hypothetical protein